MLPHDEYEIDKSTIAGKKEMRYIYNAKISQQWIYCA